MSSNASPAPFFAGEFSHGMDGKGRLTIPSPWRSGADNEVFYFFPDSSNQILFAMRPDEFLRAAEQDPSTTPTLASKREYQRWFCARAHQVTIDKQGRLVLPEGLRKIGLGSEVVMIGNLHSFEVWSKAHYEKTRREREPVYQEEARARGY